MVFYHVVFPDLLVFLPSAQMGHRESDLIALIQHYKLGDDFDPLKACWIVDLIFRGLVFSH